MSREAGELRIVPAHVEAWLRRHEPQATLLSIDPLGGGTQAGLKDYGYGRPLRIRYRAGAFERSVVLRTMSPDPFGHDRRADRADLMLLAFDTFGGIPQHIRPLEVGAFDREGVLVPMATGEVWLATEYVEGRLYADDLDRLASADAPEPGDVERAEALGRYLAALHTERAPPEAWQRTLRDAVGSGEGIFGLCDSYPADHPIATLPRLAAIEAAAVRWRWQLRGRVERSRRTHGDFHPFNLLFREGTEFSVLDCSRGAAGEPADDLTALSINYLFFALDRRGRFDGALRVLWERFWSSWLTATGDREVLEVVAPFFAWRGLVVASPVWYPGVADAVRDRLLRFVERLLAGEPFDPVGVDDLLR